MGRSGCAVLQEQVVCAAPALLLDWPLHIPAQGILQGAVFALQDPQRKKMCKILYLLFLMLSNLYQASLETGWVGQKLGTYDKVIFFLDRTCVHGNETGINKPPTSSQVCCVNSKVMRLL